MSPATEKSASNVTFGHLVSAFSSMGSLAIPVFFLYEFTGDVAVECKFLMSWIRQTKMALKVISVYTKACILTTISRLLSFSHQ